MVLEHRSGKHRPVQYVLLDPTVQLQNFVLSREFGILNNLSLVKTRKEVSGPHGGSEYNIIQITKIQVLLVQNGSHNAEFWFMPSWSPHLLSAPTGACPLSLMCCFLRSRRLPNGSGPLPKASSPPLTQSNPNLNVPEEGPEGITPRQGHRRNLSQTPAHSAENVDSPGIGGCIFFNPLLRGNVVSRAQGDGGIGHLLDVPDQRVRGLAVPGLRGLPSAPIHCSWDSRNISGADCPCI